MLVDDLTSALSGHPGALGLWLAGSRGRGDHDRYSDVDLWLVVDDVGAFVADWPALCDTVTPTVLREQVGGAPVFTHVTPDWLRFDLSVSPVADVPGRSRVGLVPLLDRAGLHTQLAGPLPPPDVDADRAVAVTKEFLRVVGLLPMVLFRGDRVLAASGATLVRRLLNDLMDLSVPAVDPGGATRRYAALSAGHRAVLETLPAIEATGESVLAVHRACGAAFVPLARELCGDRFPEELHTALVAHLRREGCDVLG
ncbi:hypothetical protein Lfu02_07230 [Longispora fulva]|uniref:Polymerase nucleotidyl transferase domain-containing protein n=1 Tax=Longispora fulva TaxID=619741 RepID=A0A8J7GR36_9ACTN|nr:nucleotidyltransferase domain-containing protein [Longispora fulva]MBG6135406.1 hypothetical protein [Longispora fulva]GIG56351.1 hypothetical protein Lfu02_07230 [Longispora fulva]